MRKRKSYVEIFKEGGIHCDSTGRIIDPSRIQTIPPDLMITEETRLVDWINKQEWADCWDHVPVVSEGEGYKIATEEDSAFLVTCPPIPDSTIYTLLEAAGLLDGLTEEYPKVSDQDWFAPEIDADKIIISEGEMPYFGLLNRLWEMIEEDEQYEGAKFERMSPEDPKAKPYLPDNEGVWQEKKGKYTQGEAE